MIYRKVFITNLTLRALMSEEIKTINPYNGQILATYKVHDESDISAKLAASENCFNNWKNVSIKERAELLDELASILENNKQHYASLITSEMGKPITQSIAEIEKCQTLCDFYAVNAEDFLADEIIETDAEESFISHDPMGAVLGIMPWNYPFWQALRFAIPTITAGNTILLKHASNVTGCALEIEKLFEKAGYPEGCFQTLKVGHEQIEKIIENDIIKAVSITGSEEAGKSIASIAGENLKKCVLELGGSNACIVLNDADLDKHFDTIFNARMQNAGQSCIAAKRFIVEEGIYDEFMNRFKSKTKSLNYNDPQNDSTTIGTLARTDLADKVQKQVEDSLAKGAKLVVGNTKEKAYFEPTILENVTPGMAVFDEETFGPVAAITKANNSEHAFQLASNSRFGLGTMIFTRDTEKAARHISDIADGAYFINDLVKSDARLPFGGTKSSGYGRELSKEGMQEFVNKKTVYITL